MISCSFRRGAEAVKCAEYYSITVAGLEIDSCIELTDGDEADAGPTGGENDDSENGLLSVATNW